MTMTFGQILEAARLLPQQEREELCAQIAESLGAPSTVEERAWVDVAEQRVQELKSGRVKGIPCEEVFATARRRLGL